MDANLRARATRLVSGRFTTEDITTLFLALRFRSHGMQSVQEIGNFVAHQGERDKGIVTDRARDIFLFLRFRFKMYEVPFNFWDMPSITPRALEANLRNMTDEVIRERCGISRTAVKHKLKIFVGKLKPLKSGNLLFSDFVSEEDEALFNAIANLITPGVTWFSDTILWKELATALEKNCLASKRDAALLEQRKSELALYAMSIMHGSRVNLGDGHYAELFVGVSAEGYLQIMAVSRVPSISNPGHFSKWGLSVFQTGAPAQDYCGDGVLVKDNFSVPIELRNGRLERLI